MIKENILRVREQVLNACSVCNRDASEITLIAVSKNFEASAVTEALGCNQHHFGENRAQELRDKSGALASRAKEIVWHFIGHLQVNKVKYVVPAAEVIHSVDSIKLIDQINRAAEQEQKVQKVFFELRTSDEETKTGIETESGLFALLEHAATLPHIDSAGLMTIAPFCDDEQVIRASFRKLRLLRDKAVSLGFPVHALSMGMTDDFEFAIAEGATHIRIGTAIFGSRY